MLPGDSALGEYPYVGVLILDLVPQARHRKLRGASKASFPTTRDRTLPEEDFSGDDDADERAPMRPIQRHRPLWVRILDYNARALLPFGLTVGAVYVFAMLLATAPGVPRAVPVERAVPVATAPITVTTEQPTLRLYGVVSAGQSLDLLARVPGTIEQVSDGLRNGGFVEKGELLFEIDQFRYEAALAEAQQQLAEAEARLSEIELNMQGDTELLALAKERLEIAERTFDRAERLQRSQTISDSTVDERRLALLAQRVDVTAQETREKVATALQQQQEAIVERLKQAVSLAQRDLDDTRIVAPFDGFINNVNAVAGRTVARNEQVAELLDANWLEVSVVMTKSQLGRILFYEGEIIGRKVKVQWNLGETPREFTATVERVNSEIDPTTGGLRVYARFDDAGPETMLRAGAFVEVLVPDRRYSDVVRLPEAALYEGDLVYILDDDSRLVVREVVRRGSDGGDVYVSGDLKEGEQALAMRIPGVGEGLKVLPRNGALGEAVGQ